MAVSIVVLSFSFGSGATAQAGVLLVTGSPGYDAAEGNGFVDGDVPHAPAWA